MFEESTEEFIESPEWWNNLSEKEKEEVVAFLADESMFSDDLVEDLGINQAIDENVARDFLFWWFPHGQSQYSILVIIFLLF